MTTRFRINTVLISTAEGDVRYSFPSDLTVLAGRTGVGKTTLLELIKYGFGGDGALADVVRNHVDGVTLEVTLGESRLRIYRSIDTAKRNVVRIDDLITQERLPDHFIDHRQQPSLNTLLMKALGLPDDARAAARTKGSSRAGDRITFADIFSYLYVPQSAINREIAHSEEGYREPKRKAVFELLFGLTNTDILKMQSEINRLNGVITEAEKEYSTVLAFLRESNTAERIDAEAAFQEAIAEQRAAEEEQRRLRDSIDPIADRETQALRDLLAEAERGLAEVRSAVIDLTRKQGEYLGERRRVQADLSRLERMHDAGERLADIEFVVCPRCMQSLAGREIPHGSCRVCLQPDPVPATEDASGDQYELLQLKDQLVEMENHLAVIDHQLRLTIQMVSDREQLVQSLTAKIDSRTAERITPRLQAYSDAADRFAVARTKQEYLKQVLRQWDRADDLGRAVQELQEEKAQIAADMGRAQSALDSRRRSIIEALNEEFQEAAATIGIPGVTTAAIHSTNYLPLLNGQRYSHFSGPGGGIITATQVAYWMSLLAVAVRDRETLYPAFLMIDSPRLALNTAEALSAALYRRLVRQADANPGRVQMIVADNELPAEYRGDYSQVDFSYEQPTIATVPHPGPDAVKLMVAPYDD
ncbi:AAA family ATPase [Microbispora bryophytorum]|uniref:AAA family ATPase n=1 Tax=Microbispora bryophytorum TaxID=1460882 RepID=UPI0033D85E6E